MRSCEEVSGPSELSPRAVGAAITKKLDNQLEKGLETPFNHSTQQRLALFRMNMPACVAERITDFNYNQALEAASRSKSHGGRGGGRHRGRGPSGASNSTMPSRELRTQTATPTTLPALANEVIRLFDFINCVREVRAPIHRNYEKRLSMTMIPLASAASPGSSQDVSRQASDRRSQSRSLHVTQFQQANRQWIPRATRGPG